MTLLDVAEDLISAYPPYAPQWGAIKAREDFDPEMPYTYLGDLATFLVDRVKADEAASFEALFAEFEKLLQQTAARNLLIVGFLEDLQNLSLNREVPLDRWREWLGPRGMDAWEAVQRLWVGTLPCEEFNLFVELPTDAR